MASTPLAYLTSYAQRRTHGPRLYWTDESGNKKTYIAVDVIPSLEHVQSSTVTQFPVQDGTTYSDHIIHFPDQLKLEIVQTNTPFEDINPSTGDVIDFANADLTLDLPATNFRPRGLLLLTLMAEGIIGAGVNAVSSLTGLSLPGSSTAPKAISVQKPTNVRDRINELIDSLTSVRLGGRLLSLQWLGKFWTGLAIESLSYKRAAGSQKGACSLILTQVNVTTTETVALPSPVDARLKAETAGGSKPAVKPSDAEAKAVEDESVAHAIFF